MPEKLEDNLIEEFEKLMGPRKFVPKFDGTEEEVDMQEFVPDKHFKRGPSNKTAEPTEEDMESDGPPGCRQS